MASVSKWPAIAKLIRFINALSNRTLRGSSWAGDVVFAGSNFEVEHGSPGIENDV